MHIRLAGTETNLGMNDFGYILIPSLPGLVRATSTTDEKTTIHIYPSSEFSCRILSAQFFELLTKMRLYTPILP